MSFVTDLHADGRAAPEIRTARLAIVFVLKTTTLSTAWSASRFGPLSWVSSVYSWASMPCVRRSLPTEEPLEQHLFSRRQPPHLVTGLHGVSALPATGCPPQQRIGKTAHCWLRGDRHGPRCPERVAESGRQLARSGRAAHQYTPSSSRRYGISFRTGHKQRSESDRFHTQGFQASSSSCSTLSESVFLPRHRAHHRHSSDCACCASRPPHCSYAHSYSQRTCQHTLCLKSVPCKRPSLF